jgi:DNA-binding winged helix-turn-helix (wHTH) protein
MTSPINFGLQSVRLTTGGERYISGKKWRLLRVLWMARGSIVRKQTIQNVVWGERRPASENSIRELVRMLRRDLDGTSLKIVNYNLSGYGLVIEPAQSAQLVRIFGGDYRR